MSEQHSKSRKPREARQPDRLKGKHQQKTATEVQERHSYIRICLEVCTFHASSSKQGAAGATYDYEVDIQTGKLFVFHCCYESVSQYNKRLFW